MAVKWNKIFRGGVQRTTPETREVPAPTTGTLFPGQYVALNATGTLIDKALAATDGVYGYFVGEALYGGSVTADLVTPNANGTRDDVRLYLPHSGDMFVGRAVVGLPRVDDLPLTVDANGDLKAAVLGTDPVVAYMDLPTHAWPRPSAPTTAGELIPVKIK